jgi:polar amino acid transport system substrate-binding protein
MRGGAIIAVNKRETPVKKIVLALIASVLAVSLMATTASAKRHADPPTLKPDTLIIGMTPPAPGFEVGTFRGTTVNNPKGMEVDLGKAIAKKLGLSKVEWYYLASFAKSYAPGPKPYDIYFGQMTITPERSKNIDFSVPYIEADQGVLVHKGLSPLPKSIADLRKLRLCAASGTTGATYIKVRIKPTKPVLNPTQTSVMFQQLKANQCDAVVYDIPIIGSQVASEPGKYGPIVGRIVTSEKYGIAFQKGSKLRVFVNPVVKALLKDGSIGKMQKKWLAADFAKLPVFKP